MEGLRGALPIVLGVLAAVLAGACATFEVVGPAGSPTATPSSTPTITPTPILGTPALVQKAHGQLANPAVGLDVAFPANTQAGDLIVVAALTGAGITPTGVSDTQSNLYLVLGSASLGGGGSDRITLFYAPGIGGGGDTVSVAVFPTTVEIAATVAEFSSAGVGLLSSKNSSNGQNIDCGTLLATNGELVFAAEIDNANPTIQPGNGFQLVDTLYASGNLGDTISDEFLAFSGPFSTLDAKFTSNPGRSWACLGGTFQ